MCNCRGNKVQTYSPQQAVSGNNQALLKQIEQQTQQAAIQRIVQQSANPSKQVIKTYR